MVLLGGWSPFAQGLQSLLAPGPARSRCEEEWVDLTWCSLAFEAVGRAQPLGSDPPWKRGVCSCFGAGCLAGIWVWP